MFDGSRRCNSIGERSFAAIKRVIRTLPAELQRHVMSDAVLIMTFEYHSES